MRKLIYFGLLFGIVLNGLLFAAFIADPNKVALSATQSVSSQQTKGVPSVGNVSQDEKLSEFEKRLLREQIESYKDSISCIKWAIGSLIGLSLAAVGFVVFKNERAYKEALAETRDAAKQSREESRIASDHREKAREWEQKAKEKYEGIDTQIRIKIAEFDKIADSKLKEIDNKTKEYINQLFEEAQKQRELSEKRRLALRASDEENYEFANNLWAEIVRENPADHKDFYNWGNMLSEWADLGGSEAEKHYNEACIKYQKAAEIKPDSCEVFCDWGNALYSWGDLGGMKAEKYYHEACIKYQKAAEIKPDSYEIYYDWGYVLYSWAELGGIEAERHYQEAITKYQKTIELNSDHYDAFDQLGTTLLALSRIKEGHDKEDIYQEAERVLLKAERIKKGAGAYNMACLFALRGDESNCHKWLKVGEEMKDLMTLKYALEDKDFALVRDKDWFKAIRWEGE